jgi:hypothetical protein
LLWPAAVTLQDISLLAAVIGGLIAAWRGVSEYRLKSQAQRAELDIQLAKHFAAVVPIANGRAGHILSETAVTALTAGGSFSASDLEAAVVILPVGAPTQAAAIRSLGELGSRYGSLRGPAESALEGLSFLEGDAVLGPARAAALEEMARATK